MAEISDEQLLALVEETFAAGQERMRNRAALRAYHAIGIETAGEDLRLASTISNYLLGMKIDTMAEVKASRELAEGAEQT